MRGSHFAHVVPFVLAAAGANAEEPHLGAAHTVALSIEGSTTGFPLGPAVDYFIVDGLSVGLHVAFDAIFSDVPFTDTLYVGARVGYALHLGDRVTFWPTVGADYYRYDAGYASDTGEDGHIMNSTCDLVGFAPIFVELAPHLFIGTGPRLDHVLDTSYGGSDFSTLRLDTIVGGWF